MTAETGHHHTTKRPTTVLPLRVAQWTTSRTTITTRNLNLMSVDTNQRAIIEDDKEKYRRDGQSIVPLCPDDIPAIIRPS